MDYPEDAENIKFYAKQRFYHTVEHMPEDIFDNLHINSNGERVKNIWITLAQDKKDVTIRRQTVCEA